MMSKDKGDLSFLNIPIWTTGFEFLNTIKKFGSGPVWNGCWSHVKSIGVEFFDKVCSIDEPWAHNLLEQLAVMLSSQ